MNTKNSMVWFKNDLRLHDNEVLCRAISSGDNLLLFYCIDPRWFRDLDLGFKKTGRNRFTFLLQCLEDLKKNLNTIEGDLLIFFGKPEIEIPKLANKYNINKIYTQEEYAIEERTVLRKLVTRLPEFCHVEEIWGHTLYHINDIPYKIDDIPMTSKAFRLNTTKNTKVREPFLKPTSYNVLSHTEKSNIPTWSHLGYDMSSGEPSNLMVSGGETEAIKRLAYYTFDSQYLTSYRWTRNKSLGLDYSSKFSPYLALGCLSSRTIYFTIKEYEEKIKKNQSTWWLIFELVWRDFFTLKGIKMGSTIYKTKGYSKKSLEFINDTVVFNRWCEGKSGIPFIDAHMRQLNKAGYMSNRGRVNCSSYLIHDLKIDWTWGAAYFENKLLDYDPHVNWMNWHYQAYEIWYTNPVHQSQKYNAKEFIHKWIPELKSVESQLIHIPWLIDDQDIDYPKPIEIYSKWNRAINKILKSIEK